jgi:hypothetical protein
MLPSSPPWIPERLVYFRITKFSAWSVIQITNEKYFARFFRFLKEIRALLHKPQ